MRSCRFTDLSDVAANSMRLLYVSRELFLFSCVFRESQLITFYTPSGPCPCDLKTPTPITVHTIIKSPTVYAGDPKIDGPLGIVQICILSLCAATFVTVAVFLAVFVCKRWRCSGTHVLKKPLMEAAF
jgi:hypothetical protein